MVMTSDFFDDLEARGLIHGASEGAREAMAAGAVTAYIGFDPTGPSLHVGHLLPVLALARLQRAGHRPIALVGGGTGMIGDPSGKTIERQLLTRADVESNVQSIRGQLGRFLDFGEGRALLIDNHDWLGGLGLIDFLREVGKHFTINYMLAKESVKLRLENEGGLSVTEFAYSLLQAFDYRELFDRHGATLQMGGSDQWGNVTSGMELIRRTRGTHVHGIVMPLVTTASGVKFGKSEAGTAVWLDAERTSPFRFYQFWLNTEDADVDRYLKFFTFLPVDEIARVVAEHEANPAARAGQRRLAEEVTRMVHGADGLERAERATAVFFGSSPAQDLPAAELLDVFADVPSTEFAKTRLEGEGIPVVDLLAESGVAASKGEARRLIAGGGISVNGERVAAPEQRVRADEAIDGQVLLLKKGKKQNHVVRLV
jgi:tyrosyl-tRNA synthetase